MREKIQKILSKHFTADPKYFDRAVFDFELLIGKDKKRTSKQNSALWLYFQQLADLLNSSGLDMKKVLKPAVDIEWTKETIHDYIWIPIQRELYGKNSTRDLEKHELDQILETINRHLAMNPATCSLPYLPFPSKPEEKPIDYPEGQETITAF